MKEKLSPIGPSMWAEGIQCAVALTFDLDAESVWISSKPANANKPGVLSQGRYGIKVGAPLVLGLLARHEVRATFFVPGVVAERYPETVEAIIREGHEIGAHGYAHTAPAAMTADEEEKELLQARQVLERFGVEVAGYRAPAWDISTNTLGLLRKHSFIYSSNLMDDIRPYWHDGGKIIELPVHWSLDDAAHFWFELEDWAKTIRTPREVLEIWKGEFEGIYEMGGVMVVTMHPQIIGRPHRLKMLEEFVEYVNGYEGVWMDTCESMARRVKDRIKAASSS